MVGKFKKNNGWKISSRKKWQNVAKKEIAGIFQVEKIM